jgi:hypothetical protein
LRCVLPRSEYHTFTDTLRKFKLSNLTDFWPIESGHLEATLESGDFPRFNHPDKNRMPQKFSELIFAVLAHKSLIFTTS